MGNVKQLLLQLKKVKFSFLLLLVVSLSSILLFFMMYGNSQNETYEISAYEISPKTIRSPKTIEDTEKTELERVRAEQAVAESYRFSEDIMKNRQALVSSIFTAVSDVKVEAKKEPDMTTGMKLKLLREKLDGMENEESLLRLSDEQLKQLVSSEQSELDALHQQLLQIIGKELSKPFKQEAVPTHRYEVERQLRQTSTASSGLLDVALSLGRAAMVETEVIDDELTEKNKADARESVEPIRILQGQVIVREGQLIDRDIYQQLKLAGVLTNQSSIKPLLGISIFVLFISALIGIHFSKSKKETQFKKKALLMFYVIFFSVILLMKMISYIDHEFDVQIAFLFPTALAPMLIKLLINERTAVLSAILTAATAGIMLQEGLAAIMQMEVALYILFGGIVSIYVISETGRRSTILQASLAVSASNLLFIIFYLLMTQTSYTLPELTFYAAAAVTSGILSGALTIGLLPFFETVFQLLSNMRLVELSNPNHPLLKKILVETPGTYHHSIMVANLADAACEAIGANGLLARVGSYYHDIGKSIHPGFFIENQHAGQNLHDSLPPEKSRDMIIAHAEDGAGILEKHHMPAELVAIARQHHGTSLLKFFYVKAKEMNTEVKEEDFRYPGPKPQTKEIAVIMIADSVEAAVRSMKEPTPEKIASLVEAIVRSKVEDDQFDECDLSMKEIKQVKRVICETMNGIFHNRIEYPD
ncbi:MULTISPECIES: HD family phosphohydrolase [Sporosarcina]|uniref:HD family phosphohydrolase n=1 Tax=Sporosarcina TaxID=1569 RepID=UPI001E59E681|nr:MULTISPECIES: HDIG domain-containing metalloprotein [Sporosarcina]GKV64646.1 cyclic-di-AMP phosphodiesterase PgpH [Sporosarcina sp. NCCP-2331]GLB54481.1 cyclic-di-AMP phosphodiesterase PgpH [Sporosarcina sp. NCCP-2378]